MAGELKALLARGEFVVAPAEKLKAFGFSIAIYPNAGMGAACFAIDKAFSYLKENQTLENCPVPAYDMKQLHGLVGFPDVWEFEKRHVETK